MAMKILINGREVRNPIVRLAFALGAALFGAVFFGLAMLLLLPLIGIAVTLWLEIIAMGIVFGAVFAVYALWQVLSARRRGVRDLPDGRRRLKRGS
jgi:hypothetical protein